MRDLRDIVDATYQRIQRASERLVETEDQDVLLPTGMKSGVKRRIIMHPIQTAHRRKWITDAQFRAGDKFRQHLVLSRFEPRVTMAWRSMIDGSTGGDKESISESRLRHKGELISLMALIKIGWRDAFLSWMVEAECDDVSVTDLGARFTPLKFDDAKKAVGIMVLSTILDDIAVGLGL